MVIKERKVHDKQPITSITGEKKEQGLVNAARRVTKNLNLLSFLKKKGLSLRICELAFYHGPWLGSSASQWALTCNSNYSRNSALV